MEDSSIVDLYWQRDEKAISETAGKYERYLLKIAYNVLGDMRDASEVVNDTYLKAWNAMPESRPVYLNLFLGRITRDGAIDLFRKNRSRRRYVSEGSVCLEELAECIKDEKACTDRSEYNLLKELLNGFLGKCSREEAAIFICRYYYMDSIAVIAGYSGYSQAKIKSMLFRLRKRLAAVLEKEGFRV